MGEMYPPVAEAASLFGLIGALLRAPIPLTAEAASPLGVH